MDFPFGSNYFIRQNNKPCDILCPCKENTFDISNKCENPENTKWILTEDSNPFYNFYCCQYRAMELLAKNNKDDQMTLYKGERPCLIPFFSCEQIQMKIYKYIYQDGKLINKNQIGYIQAFSQDFQRECKVSQIFQKPLIKIIKNVKSLLQQCRRKRNFMIIIVDNVAYLMVHLNIRYTQKQITTIVSKLEQFLTNFKVVTKNIVQEEIYLRCHLIKLTSQMQKQEPYQCMVVCNQIIKNMNI
ncbi:unnamed protein product [Paramecium sonneborni]|uniref:Uncharacterized protein n=1 Tax=Paramecium sonneborni TaxID=65129 RepID=A0A8S1KKW5_9CILI|nr:unnamed protein product [Paramecium sonneborni]